MSLATDTAARTDRGATAVGADVIVDLKPMWIGLAVLNVFYLIVRVYEQIYGWRAGLDSFAPEFQTYWLSILWTEIPLELVSGIALAGYLWKTRIRDMSAVTPRQEMRAIVDNAKWLTAYAVAIYWGASFFTEQDGTWHMTVIRDTDFTPSHIIEFYMSYPIYSIIAVGCFFHAKTRIPYFSKGYSLAYLIVAIGPFMIIPNVGLNEWGCLAPDFTIIYTNSFVTRRAFISFAALGQSRPSRATSFWPCMQFVHPRKMRVKTLDGHLSALRVGWRWTSSCRGLWESCRCCRGCKGG